MIHTAILDDIVKTKSKILSTQNMITRLSRTNVKGSNKFALDTERNNLDDHQKHLNKNTATLSKMLTTITASCITVISVSKKMKRCQIAIQMNGTSYTRHLKKSGESWVGQSIYQIHDANVTYKIEDSELRRAMARQQPAEMY